jgi:hypothetical protein
MPGQILIPKFGRRGREADRADRALRDPELFEKYVAMEKAKYRRRAGSIFQRYKNYQHNKKAELRLEGVVDARTWFRWQQEDPYFWHDDSNVKKILKQNKEFTPWKS